MPKLNIDMFDEDPKVGDKVKVMGKIKSIDEDSGEVEVTYDDVSIVHKKRKSRDNNDYNNDNNDDEKVVMRMDQQTYPQDQSLDSALARAFPNTQ